MDFPHQQQRESDKPVIIGTDDIPTDGEHVAHLCHCGQYHSNFKNPNALKFRYLYHDLLRKTTNPMQLMMRSHMFMQMCRMQDAAAFDELMEDDIRRKQLGVEEQKVQVELEHQMVSEEALNDEMKASVNALNAMAQTLQPQIQRNWNTQQEQQSNNLSTNTTQENNNIKQSNDDDDDATNNAQIDVDIEEADEPTIIEEEDN